MDRIVREMVSGRPVVIFSRSSCGISHSIKTLICEFGTNPCVYELNEMPKGQEIEQEIGQALSRRGCIPTVPAVFIGGQLVGGSKEIFSLHLNQALRPMLQRAGALWV